MPYSKSAKAKKNGRGKTAEHSPSARPESSAPYARIQMLQRTAGNSAVSALFHDSIISRPDDESEQQADRVAEQVTNPSGISGLPQRTASPFAGVTTASHTPIGGGEKLDALTQASMEPYFGLDFGGVRVHTGPKANEAARNFDARAFTVGSDIVFGAGEYEPHTPAGQSLLAHELTHVAQPQTNTVARAVASDYSSIKDKLTYKFTDWAITDKEAHDVLTTLSALSATDFTDTLQAMETDDLVSPLLENISKDDKTAFASLIQKIHTERGTTAIAKHIESLMSYEVVLDWVITDAEAHEVLEALKSLTGNPIKLRDVVTALPDKQYERFYSNLSSEDRSENLRFLQDIEMMRSSGMTMQEMTATQKAFLEAQATAAGKTTGEFIAGEAASRGYGGSAAVWWTSLTPDQKKERSDKFQEVLNDLRNSGPKEVREVIRDAEAAGGGIVWDPDECEENDAFAVNQGDKLSVGKDWLESAEKKRRDVYDNVVHELGGHRQYGDEASWDIMKGVLAALSSADRTAAEGGAQSPYTAYGYMESEAYAELREYPYRTKGSQTDDPVTNVEEQLTNIKIAFQPTVAEAIVRGFRRRLQLDARVSRKSKRLFDKTAERVFSIKF